MWSFAFTVFTACVSVTHASELTSAPAQTSIAA